jgi:hypothetical protein
MPARLWRGDEPGFERVAWITLRDVEKVSTWVEVGLTFPTAAHQGSGREEDRTIAESG